MLLGDFQDVAGAVGFPFVDVDLDLFCDFDFRFQSPPLKRLHDDACEDGYEGNYDEDERGKHSTV